MTEERGRSKKPPAPLDRRAVADGARDAVVGNNGEQAFIDRVAEQVRRSLLINQEPADSFADGVEAQRHWRDEICPNGESHGYGPWVEPAKPATRKLSKPGEVVEFEEHHVDVFQAMTPPVAEAFKRFLIRLYRRDVTFGWILEQWKWIGAAIGAGIAWAKWGHANWPDIQTGLVWLLEHLP